MDPGDLPPPFDDQARIRLLDRVPELVMVFDDQARIRWMNQTARDLMGYRLEDIIGTSVFDFVHPDDLGYMLSSWEKRVDHPDEPGLIVQGRALNHDGSWRAYEIIGLSLLDDDAVGGMVITARDLSRQSALADSPARLRSMVDRTTDIVLLLDADGRFSFANRRLTVLSGHDSDRIIGSPWTTIVHPDDVETATAWFDQLIAGGDGATSRVQVRLDGPGRRSVHVELHGTNQIADPLIDGVIVSARDVEELVAMQRMLEERNERLSHAVTHDQLTGLFSRRAFVDAVGDLIALRRGRQGPGTSADVVVLFCDLDGFKDVNDSHGHAVGDRVLQEIAARLERGVRESDIVARYGGDEFTVLLGEDEPAAAVSALVARLTGALTTPVTVDGVTTRVGVSIGVSREPADTAEVDSLLSAADAAMYNRKRSAQAARDVAGPA
ncbi:MAG: diguanylate cyclase [Acidimicrobiales bacterium]